MWAGAAISAPKRRAVRTKHAGIVDRIMPFILPLRRFMVGGLSRWIREILPGGEKGDLWDLWDPCRPLSFHYLVHSLVLEGD